MADKKSLVIVESPAKAKTIEKYLGKGYTVKASKGHVVDLPKSGLGVDVDDDFAPDYAPMPGKEKVIAELKRAAKGMDEVIIASDPDREGEAIGWHVAASLGLIDRAGRAKHKAGTKKPELKRITFSEITQSAVQDAIAHPRHLDQSLFEAQQTRRILDRLVGYKLSPLLWMKIRYGLSAGRVQSIAVRLIVERELERQKFNAEEYWQMIAHVVEEKAKLKTELLIAEAREKLPEPEKGETKFNLVKLDGKEPALVKQVSVEKLLGQLPQGPWLVKALETKEVKRSPKAPFTTSQLQQTAANWFSFSAKRTMQLAQTLYEQGFITYMRTDSTNLASSALEQARAVILKEHGEKALPEKANIYSKKVKVAQEAHEAIRPADFNLFPGAKKLEKLPAETQKLYKLIWQRALASQMLPAKLESTSITIEVKSEDGKHKLEFRATGQRLIFPGYLAVYPEKYSESVIPAVEVGSELYPVYVYGSQHFTQPPARFTEASLIKELEKHGIGRPSTYAPIISTIQSRQYVVKEGPQLVPTDTAFVVTKLLNKHFAEIVDVDFTAEMEDGLDAIANGEKGWQAYLGNFYKPFAKKLQEKEKEIAREDFTVLGEAPADIKCPDCGGVMQIKLGKFGRFYSCAKFPECKGILSMSGETEEQVAEKAQTAEFREYYQAAPKTEDGRDYLLKQGRFGKFWAHPDYPKVKDAQPLQFTLAKRTEIYGEAPLTKDKREFLLKSGRFGPFWAHPDYPKVKETVRLKIDKSKLPNI